jgi:serine/threonine-protein kinase RsbW
MGDQEPTDATAGLHCCTEPWFWYSWTSLRKNSMDVVRLAVPGTLLYRDLVLRVVASVCRLVRRNMETTQEASRRVEDFDDKVVSAVGEAFNNIAIHAYDASHGDAEIEVEFDQDRLIVRLLDTGEGFNISAEVAHDPRETLRESYMGLEIMLACMDDVSYTRGGPTTPNVLTMTKCYFSEAGAAKRRA